MGRGYVVFLPNMHHVCPWWNQTIKDRENLRGIHVREIQPALATTVAASSMFLLLSPPLIFFPILLSYLLGHRLNPPEGAS